EDRQERGVLEPARVELRIVVIATYVRARVRGIKQRRLSGMVLGGQILPAARVVGPVGQPGGCQVQTCGYLAAQCVPGGGDIGGPEDRPIALRAEIGVARQSQRTLLWLVLAESVVKRGGME